MKRNNRLNEITNFTSELRNSALVVCSKLLAEMQQAKAAILQEFRGGFDGNEHLLRLAMNEAEALAWQSGVPQLVFPTLAREKAQAAAAWHRRQRAIRQNRLALAFAA
jgi:hypothetical protein